MMRNPGLPIPPARAQRSIRPQRRRQAGWHRTAQKRAAGEAGRQAVERWHEGQRGACCRRFYGPARSPGPNSVTQFARRMPASGPKTHRRSVRSDPSAARQSRLLAVALRNGSAELVSRTIWSIALELRRGVSDLVPSSLGAHIDVIADAKRRVVVQEPDRNLVHAASTVGVRHR